MSKSLAQKLHDRTLKLMRWTCRAEEALTRRQALKALKKIAKHSRKLAQLQGRVYTESTQEDTP
jgi:hypothetical protein